MGARETMHTWGVGRQVLIRPEARGSVVLKGCVGAPGFEFVQASVERERGRSEEDRLQFMAGLAALTAGRTDDEVRAALLAGDFTSAPQQPPMIGPVEQS